MSHLKLTLLERGELDLHQHIKRWSHKTDLVQLDYNSALYHLYALCCHVLSIQQTSEPNNLCALPHSFVQFCAQLKPELLQERHILGWFHQHYHEMERKRSFSQVEHDQAKHSAPIISTQLYTPAWLADAMVHMAITAREQTRLPIVFDPACGGGQLLLAAVEHARQHHPNIDMATLADTLHGCDLDPTAVKTTRLGLLLALGPQTNNIQALRQTLEQNIVVADGLTYHPPCAPDVILSNPPYMGLRAMPLALKTQLNTHWKPFHHDLYTCFLARCMRFKHATVAVLGQQTVWYLKRFEAARKALLQQMSLLEMVHLGPHVFRSLSGEKASVVITLHQNRETSSPTRFLDLRSIGTVEQKHRALQEALNTQKGYATQHLEAFADVPGQPLVYWLPKRLLAQFSEGQPLGEVAEIPGSQNKTGQNARFVKSWQDVPQDDIHHADILWETHTSNGSWRFYSKGGRYAPWWGNWRHVVDWSEQARAFYKDNKTSNLLAQKYWDRQGLCYTDFGGQRFNARWLPKGCVFDMTGPAIFSHRLADEAKQELLSWLAVLNSTAARQILNALNPSLHYQVRDLRNLPLPPWTTAEQAQIAQMAQGILNDYMHLHRHLPTSPQRLWHEPPKEDIIELSTRANSQWQQVNEIICELYGVHAEAVNQPIHHDLRHLIER